MNFYEFASSTQVSVLLQDRPPLILMDDSFNVKEAIKILSTQNILSAPVLSGPVAPSHRNFLGFIDVLDLLSYCISLYPSQESNDKHLPLSEMWKIGRTFALTPIDQVINHSKRDPVEPLEYTESIWTLMEKMRNGIHRVPITKDSTFVGIITQSDIIRFIGKNLNFLGEHATKTLEELGLINDKVDSIASNKLAIEAFQHMFDTKRSALAVVASNPPPNLSPSSNSKKNIVPGELVGSLSASEVRRLFPGQFDPGVHALSKLNAPILKFLRNTAQQRVDSLTVCTKETSLTSALLKIVSTRSHRAWIIDDHQHPKPVGIMSLTDVLNKLLILYSPGQ